MYIKGTIEQGLLFPRGGDLQLKDLSDADWAGCVETRKSITGFCVFLGNALVPWRAKKQTTVSRSSSEAEYRALAATTYEVQWLICLLND